MKKFRDILETVYPPKPGDEKNFADKHIVDKKDYPNAAPGQFTSDKKKAKRVADYDEGEEEKVYEAAELHTKRADKEAVIVRAVDPKTGQSKARVVKRSTGEIKIGEEVELDELKVPSKFQKAVFKLAHGKTPKEYAAFNKADSEYQSSDTLKRLKVGRADDNTYKKGETPKDKNSVIHGSPAHMQIRAIDRELKKRNEEVELELDEKAVNPYAVGMAAAMKQAGDKPPLKKSTIVKGHEIAKSIKKEAMDPVGKHDADIDNDGDTDKSDKYLIKRRKAISRAVNEAAEVSHARYMGAHGKKARDTGQSGNWMFTHKSKGDVDYNDEKEVHSTRGKFADAKKSAQEWAKEHGHHTVYVMEEVDLDEGHGVFLKGGSVGETRSGKPVKVHSSIEDAKAHAKRMNALLSPGEKKNYGLKYHVKPVAEGFVVVDLDEVSKATLGSYIKKASVDASEKRMKSDRLNTAAYSGKNNNDEFMALDRGANKAYKSSQNRLKGIAKATDKLTKEETNQIDEAFKVGAMHLEDGSSITLTREDVDMLNNLFNQLNSSNKSKMEQRLKSSKNGFNEIITFAKEVV